MKIKSINLLILLFLYSCKTLQLGGGGSGGGGTIAGLPSASELEDYVKNLNNMKSPDSDEPNCQTSENQRSKYDKIVIGIPGSGVWPESYTESLKSQMVKNGNSKFNYDIINEEINDNDLREIGCPNYNNMDNDEKMKFWVIFTSSVAKAESDLDPGQIYPETDGDKTWSTGLCQIDPERANDWCTNVAIESGLKKEKKPVTNFKYVNGFFSYQDMQNPDLNLRCCITMLGQQVKRNKVNGKGTLFPTPSWYWSVLSKNNPKKVGVVKDWFGRHAGVELPSCQEKSAFNDKILKRKIIDYNSGSKYEISNNPYDTEHDPRFGEGVEQTDCKKIVNTNPSFNLKTEEFAPKKEKVNSINK